jgi:sugar lactone lactonase YvrE
VLRAGLDGANPVELSANLTGAPAGLAVDATHAFFTAADRVMKVPIAGGAAVTVASGQAGPGAVAIDGNTIYWANTIGSSIVRANLDGSNATVLAVGQAGPRALALDGTHVYWTNYGAGTVTKAAR